MKKIKKIATVFSVALVGIFASITLINLDKDNLFFVANEGYQIKLDGINNPVQGVTMKLEDSPHQQLFYGGDYVRYPVTSLDGNQSVIMFAECAFVNPDGLVALGYEGSLGNAYLKNEPYHSRINGLKSLTVHYTGGPLTVNYGYEQDMAKGQYRVTCQPIESGVAYNFDNNFPQYFSINTELAGYSLIQDVSIVYSCNQIDQKLPETPYYDSGYDVGAISRPDDEAIFVKEVHSDTEAFLALEESVVRHYQASRLTFAYDNIGTLDELLSIRRNFSHVAIASMVEKQIVKGETIDFVNIFFGDVNINNDDLLAGEDLSKGELGFRYHNDVASFYTNPTAANTFDSLRTANSAIRLNYAKNNNLLRPSNFDDFAIEKLDDSRFIDVYNSEDLWWAAEHGYKPNFIDTDGKAAWIYNEAKKILNSIIYDGMSNFEKIRAIYEWIIDNCQYDHDALGSSRNVCENKCFFLEGVFERRLAVCDGFSKTFVLLGKMEGLDVKRGLGYGPEGGHAWGLARTNPSEDYYLVCPTWGDIFKNIGTNESPIIVTSLTYEAFMTSTNYFADASKGTNYFTDLVNIETPSAQVKYAPSIYALDKLPGYANYNYSIDTTLELTTIVNEALKACENENFAIDFVFEDPSLVNKAVQAVQDSNVSFDKWDVRMWQAKPLYDVTEYCLGFVLR